MIWSEIRPGVIVYHGLFTHLGKGVVVCVQAANMFESMFEKGNRRVVVDWEDKDASSRHKLLELRKSPNKKKIRDMVRIYKLRGQEAKDGGHILILPKATTTGRTF